MEQSRIRRDRVPCGRYEPSPPDMSVVTYLVPFQLPVILLSIQSPTHPGFSSKEHSWHGSPPSPPLLSMSTLINLSRIKLPTEFWIRPDPRDTTDSPSQLVSIARLHIRMEYRVGTVQYHSARQIIVQVGPLALVILMTKQYFILLNTHSKIQN